MTNSASRKQARRFWGAMGAVMRRSSRLLDARGSQTPTDNVIRRADGLREIRFDARAWRGT
jgi:hypothetical protein